GGCVVLPRNPVCHQHRAHHQFFQHAAIGVITRVIIVQEHTAQYSPTATLTRTDQKCSVATQPPFRSCLCSIIGTASEFGQQVFWRKLCVHSQRRCTLMTDTLAGCSKRSFHFFPV